MPITISCSHKALHETHIQEYKFIPFLGSSGCKGNTRAGGGFCLFENMGLLKQNDGPFYLFGLGIGINLGIGNFIADDFWSRLKNPADMFRASPSAILVEISPVCGQDIFLFISSA